MRITSLAIPGQVGPTGPVGKSAYQSAVDGGYVGTEAQWIASLKGAKGDTGSASTVAGPSGARGSVWASGAGAPSGSAAAGDQYLDTSNGDVWQFS